VHEETFGPVIPMIRCPNEIGDVIRSRTRPPMGSRPGVCTNRLDYITRFINELQVGTVNVWEVPGYRIEMSPFGRHQGFRARLQGRRGRGDEELHQCEDLFAALACLGFAGAGGERRSSASAVTLIGACDIVLLDKTAPSRAR
jgi:hypothetical protein